MRATFSLFNNLLRFSDPVYRFIENFWEDRGTQRRIANLLVWAFLGNLLLVELARHALLPAPLTFVGTKHFDAVSRAFTVLLGFEILGLVFVLPGSVSDSLGKQFEILSIILLRECFQKFVNFDEPIKWEGAVIAALLPILSNAAGGLLTFVAIGVFYRLQRHRPITSTPAAQEHFRATKRLLALVLLVAFIAIGVGDIRAYLRHETVPSFLDTFFTVLVFSDILLIFLSLRYSSSYQVVFRNSGFALATVLIRLSVIAPDYYNAALALGSAALAVCLTLAYNAFTPSLSPQELAARPQEE